jgi:hypothetical protein
MSGMDSARWLQLDEFGFHHTLASLPGNTLVLFGQPGCSACRAWRQLLDSWQPDGLQQLAYVDVQKAWPWRTPSTFSTCLPCCCLSMASITASCAAPCNARHQQALEHAAGQPGDEEP